MGLISSGPISGTNSSSAISATISSKRAGIVPAIIV